MHTIILLYSFMKNFHKFSKASAPTYFCFPTQVSAQVHLSLPLIYFTYWRHMCQGTRGKNKKINKNLTQHVTDVGFIRFSAQVAEVPELCLTYIYTYIHIHIYTYIYTHIHTYTYAHIRKYTPVLASLE